MPRDTAPCSATPAANAAAPAVRIREARLDFGGAALFAGLDLTLAAGATTCLLGPSGVGKSSLLRLIAGLPGSGGGRVGDGDGQPLQGRIAYMAQQDLLLPWLSALDNVLIGYRLRGDRVTPAVRARARDLLGHVGLGDRAGDRPAALSGGMRQRVALARTLLEERPVVLMDEPFAGLDAIGRHALQDLAATMLAGRTVLVVTHDPLEALRLGDRLLVMAGRPATLSDRVAPPPGVPPRPVEDPALLALQGSLLAQLAEARAQTT